MTPCIEAMTDAGVARKYYAYKHVTKWTDKPIARYAVCYTPSSKSWEVREGEWPEFKCENKEVFDLEKDGQRYQFVLVEVELIDDVRREERYATWEWFYKSDLLFYFGRNKKFNAETQFLLGSVLGSSLDG